MKKKITIFVHPDSGQVLVEQFCGFDQRFSDIYDKLDEDNQEKLAAELMETILDSVETKIENMWSD